MLIKCIECGKLYEENEEQQIILYECGCEMICYECQEKMQDNKN